MFLAVLSVVLLCYLLAGLRSGIYCGSAVEDDAMLVSLSRLAPQRQANICCRALQAGCRSFVYLLSGSCEPACQPLLQGSGL